MSGPMLTSGKGEGEKVGDGEETRRSPTPLADVLWVAMREAECVDNGGGEEGDGLASHVATSSPPAADTVSPAATLPTSPTTPPPAPATRRGLARPRDLEEGADAGSGDSVIEGGANASLHIQCASKRARV